MSKKTDCIGTYATLIFFVIVTIWLAQLFATHYERDFCSKYCSGDSFMKTIDMAEKGEVTFQYLVNLRNYCMDHCGGVNR